MKTYESPMRRYHSVEQALVVLSLLGYEATRDKNTDRILPRMLRSKTNMPERIALVVSESYPHRVVVRALRYREGE